MENTIFCANCGKEYQFDPLMGYGCLVFTDDRQVPRIILGAWCNEACLNKWTDTPEGKDLLAPRL